MKRKNNTSLLLAVTNGLWLIEETVALNLGHNVARLLSGEGFWNEAEFELKKKDPEFLIIEASGGSFYASNINKAPAGSVAVINISGPIMKEDNCGDPGTKTYESMILKASENPNIDGIILQIDSPGGTVSGTQSLANVVRNASKPIVTYAEDLMASAAYWIGSSAKYVFAATNTTRIGSIGTMFAFADMQPAWEKLGVKFHEINATASTEKNADFAEARKGNYDQIRKNMLDPLNNEFLAAVRTNRGAKLNEENTLKGQVHVAADALKNGLIDEVGGLDKAVSKVRELASASEKTKISQNQNMKTIAILASQAALLALFGATVKEGEASVEVELSEEKIAQLEAALSAGNTAKTDLATKVAELATAKDKVTSLEQKVTELGKKNPGSTTTVKEGDDKFEVSSDEDDFTCEADENLKASKAKIGF